MKTKLLFLFTFYSILSISQTNLVTDGGLENWISTTNLTDWTIENDVSQNTTDMTEGTSSASLKIIGDSFVNPKILTQVPLESGISYTVSYKFKYVTTSFAGSHSVCLKLEKTGSATTSTSCSIPNDNLWGSDEITFTPDQTGDYDLSISTSNFFGSNSFEVIIDEIKVFDPLSLSVNDIHNKESFNIYPTITDGNIYFDQLEQVDNFKLSVYDTNGRKQNVIFENNSIDLSGLATGMYLVNLKTNTKNITKRVIKK